MVKVKITLFTGDVICGSVGEKNLFDFNNGFDPALRVRMRTDGKPGIDLTIGQVMLIERQQTEAN